MSLEQVLRAQLITLSAGNLPLALVPNFLASVEEHDRRERQALGTEVIQRLLAERDNHLIGILRDARASVSLLRTVSEHLAADRLSRQRPATVTHRLELSEPARVVLRHLHGQELGELRAEASRLLNEIAPVLEEKDTLERAIAAAPDDADIASVVKHLKGATHALTLLNEQASQLDAAITAQRAELEECGAKLRQLWLGKMDKAFAHEDGA